MAKRRSRRTNQSLFLLMLSAGAASPFVIPYVIQHVLSEEARSDQQKMRLALQDARACIAGVKGITAASTDSHKIFYPQVHNLLRTRFAMKSAQASRQYSATAEVETALEGVDFYLARAPRAQYAETQILTHRGDFSEAAALIPPEQRAQCLTVSPGCLRKSGWREETSEGGMRLLSPMVKTGSGVTIDGQRLSLVFDAQGNPVSLQEETLRPPYLWEMHRGDTLDPALAKAGDAVGECQAKALETQFGPSNE
jgi:hypothetical protein